MKRYLHLHQVLNPKALRQMVRPSCGRVIRKRRWGDFFDFGLPQNNLFEEGGFFTGSGSGAGQSVENEKVERRTTVLMTGIFDLLDNLSDQIGTVNRFRADP